ncbi:MAG: GH25 family lysozyme M1 (1,4-beta-N-acetylmuramidase) [Pseudoalteromonas tetraodonis]|jgi:GH25 family lysozyme M1 (1,4-beta-N-acetylmuramidase)
MDFLVKSPLLLLLLSLFLCQCAPTNSGRVQTDSAATGSSRGLQEIVNVSSWDPKARSRDGRSYSTGDVSALRANGAKGLIARAGKGGNLDTKCSSFLASADRSGMLPGVYYRVQKHVDPVRQADQFVARARSLANSRSWRAPALLLCGDYDGDLPLSHILKFMDRVEEKTGVVPVAYLENSQDLKLKTRAASQSERNRLRRAPYWLALYSHTSGAGPIFPAPGNPRGLVNQYSIWSDWTLWQYGGVGWENGAARQKVYSHGKYRFSQFFGNMDRPVERNVFRGSDAQLRTFWQRHGMKL